MKAQSVTCAQTESSPSLPHHRIRLPTERSKAAAAVSFAGMIITRPSFLVLKAVEACIMRTTFSTFDIAKYNCAAQGAFL